MRPTVHLDFEHPGAPPARWGGLMLALALGALGATLLAYQSARERRAGVELRLANLQRLQGLASDTGAPRAGSAQAQERALLELSVPWTQLLAELEQASADSRAEVAVLAVEPDASKRLVHVQGEAKTLALAIAYVQRLQHSRLLHDPMLDRHQVRTDDAQHPVRFELTAQWRGLP